MTASRRRCPGAAALLAGLAASLGLAATAHAHSASNAYLTLTAVAGEPLLHAQWDVSLRDLEFLLGINRSDDGKLTWGELSARREDVQRYVYSRIAVSAAGKACAMQPKSLQVDDHADAAYAVLFFDLRCGSRAPAALTLDYSLFFDIDPSHRGIFVLRNGDAVSTALFAPDNTRIHVALSGQP